MSGRVARDPGSLRTPLELQRAVTTDDGFGGLIEAWQLVATVFAAITPKRIAQNFEADQDIETATLEVTIRHRPDVESGMRFAIGARVLRIVTVSDPDETGRFLVCTVEERS